MTTPIAHEELARQALDGDRDALDTRVRALQGDVYGLALRMLWNQEDAEDATQKILVRVVTRLSQFGFRSRLKTWVYRLAVNYILDLEKSPIECQYLSFEAFAESLATGHVPASATHRAVDADRRSEGGMQSGDAAVSRSSAPHRVRAGRHHGDVGPRSCGGAGHRPGALQETAAACT
jgi:DNA-directed RNA polymerase specialized sigma24 family protein